MFARLSWLSLLTLSACVREVENHCANQDAPDEYCGTIADVGEFCSQCESKDYGCVAVLTEIKAECRPDGATSVADDGSTDDSATMTSQSTSSADDASTSVSADETSTTMEPATGSESGTTGDPAVCGNGTREGHEECDGADTNDENCADHMLGAGEPTCNENCTFNFLPCENDADCGNGIVEGAEDCEPEDGGRPANLDGETCESLPDFGGGDLSCDQMCKFNTSACTDCLELLADCQTAGQCCDETCNELLGC